jgi:hypothetical protein
MSWATTMAGNADNAAHHRNPSEDNTHDGVESGSWNPHQVWLTRIKQPRDSRQYLTERSATKLTIQSPRSHLRTR